jgi:hypothetical protein
MSNITIFEEQGNLPTVRRESRRMDRMGGGGSTVRRIKLSNGRSFKRVVGGEEIGREVDQQLEVIIVDWLNEPSREFYQGAYDKNVKGALPDCWSNNGDKPDSGAKKPQANSCRECPNNVKGSGTNGQGKACRYKRRIAVLIAGDPTGDIYQIPLPGASIFAENDGNVYGFEGYKKFLLANGEGMDTVVTRVSYDRKVETIKVQFKAVRHLTADEVLLVDTAQDDPTLDRYTHMTVGAVGSAPALAAPTKAAAIAPPPAKPAANPFGDDDEDEVVEVAPAKRASKPKAAVAEVKPELASVLGEWLDNDEED